MKKRILTGKDMERMERNGWSLWISKFNESDEELIARVGRWNDKVKLYYTTTSVRGYYNTVAMAK